MTTGTMNWFNSQKVFRFITPDSGGSDAIVHISAVERSGPGGLREAQKADYEPASAPKSDKPAAENLKAPG